MVCLRPIILLSGRAGWRRNGAARRALLTAAVLPFLVASGLAAEPNTEKGKDVVISVPERGLLYVRYGAPGGVKIHSVRRPASPKAHTPGVAAVSPDRAESLALILREELRLMLSAGWGPAVSDVPRVSGPASPFQVHPSDPVLVRREVAAGGATPVQATRDLSGPGVTQAGAASALVSPDSVERGVLDTSAAPALVRPDSVAPEVTDIGATPVPVNPDLGDLGAEEAAVDLQTSGVLRTTRIRFAYGHADVLPESEPALRTLAEILKRNLEWRVRVEGHTDRRGDECYNLHLSAERAKSVVRLLVDRYGIDPNRLKVLPLGEGLPLIDEETEEAYAANRRVEFRLLD